MTTVLLDRQLVYLDSLALEIRKNTGKGLNRAEIIRALIDALEASGLDVAHVTSEADLSDLVADRLRV